MAPLVGLVTDFGWGPYAGLLRAVARCLGAEPLDLDHSVPSFEPLAGAYVLYSSYRWLPPGSGFSVVVDPGVGGPRRALLLETRHYYMAGPDNGVLYPAAVEDGVRAAYELDPSRVQAEARARSSCPAMGVGWRVSSTFHGRDLFTPAAALAALGVDPGRLGVEVDVEGLARLDLVWGRARGDGYTEYRVVYVDKFGNVALSTREAPRPGSRLQVLPPRSTRPLEAVAGRTFSDAPPGGLVAYLNSFGFLELAVNRGSAASLLGARLGDTVALRAAP